MTHQPDMLLAEFTDVAVLARIDAQLPKAREVRAPRLPNVLTVAETTGKETFHGDRDIATERK